jgi:glutamyl-tRNA synthetase
VDRYLVKTCSHITRLAPSPTGALHLGNARTFLINWAMARQRGWKIILRIEDLDGPRVKPGVIDLTIDLLSWLGIDWDEGPMVQSADLTPYRDAMHRLASGGWVYPSELSRTEIETAASAPQEGIPGPAGGSEVKFPASMRPPEFPSVFDNEGVSWRFATPPGPVEFTDGYAGTQSIDPSQTVGDFAVWTRRGQPAYQLAVVVDDIRQGVTHVVRGDDLLDSAARQMRLYRALGAEDVPAYVHLPLVRGGDGKRLAKRHGDTRLDAYRAAGVTPERVIGLVYAWTINWREAVREPLSAATFLERFRLDTMRPEPVIYSSEDHAWLFQGLSRSSS